LHHSLGQIHEDVHRTEGEIFYLAPLTHGCVLVHSALLIDTTLRLSKLFGSTVDFWMNLQLACDVYEAEHSRDARSIQKIEKLQLAAGHHHPAEHGVRNRRGSWSAQEAREPSPPAWGRLRRAADRDDAQR
jgi:FAD/FMN-containing dehydrogenase